MNSEILKLQFEREREKWLREFEKLREISMGEMGTLTLFEEGMRDGKVRFERDNSKEGVHGLLHVDHDGNGKEAKYTIEVTNNSFADYLTGLQSEVGKK